MIESARRRAAVEFSKIRVVNSYESSGNRAKSNIQIVSIDITEVIEIGEA